jgi:hypothetical protein
MATDRAAEAAHCREEAAVKEREAVIWATDPGDGEYTPAMCRDMQDDATFLARALRCYAEVLDPSEATIVTIARNMPDDVWAEGHADYDHGPENCVTCARYVVAKVCAALAALLEATDG